MPFIQLSDICNEPTYRGRYLEYHVRRTRPRSWTLQIVVNVVYRWAFDYAGKWDEARKARFRSAFARNASRTWSRRYSVWNGDPADGGSVGVEVHIDVVEKPHHPNDTWQVLVYPERPDRTLDAPEGFDEQPQPIRCAPRFSGWPHDLPRPVRPSDEVRRVGMCFLFERSVEIARVLPDDPHVQRASDHEVGHMLGLDHPGGICSEDRCYGRGETRHRIMGMGMEVTHDDYAFAPRIMHHYSHTPIGRRAWWLYRK